MVSIKNNIIRATQGDTIRTTVKFYMPKGTEYVPEQGDVIRFALKSTKKPDDTAILLNVNIPIDSMELVIPAEETKKIPSRRTPYFYDVQITFASGEVYTFIHEGEYYSLPEVV